MQLFLIFVLFSKLALSLQTETVIQFAYTEVVGRADTPVTTRTLNGVSIPWNDSAHGVDSLRDILFQTEQGPFLEKSLEIILDSFNHTTASNHTYQRMRKCQLDGYRVRWVSDLVRYDGADYLRLNGSTNTWTAAVPQAKALQQVWASDAARTRSERVCLENACTELLKDLAQAKHSALEDQESQAVMLVWVTLLAAASLLGLTFISFLLFKRQASNGSGHPGGQSAVKTVDYRA
ncbi:hypothetical protein AAFF_G00186010 [Aldrovandia affinis]|uniref:MHC class I-like antigen recognition-like domain-containing protein n=1 Tax=Aldrovandia affinis TaxID=143900 RepID=A0AAD7SXK6_9TELE|nr:hypothetical protein AAFF_G00186010 [Aldrovandia affinis]